jgi:hypothetical protein
LRKSAEKNAFSKREVDIYQSVARPDICIMKKIMLLTLLCGSLLALTPGCNRNTLTGSKLTLANYDQVTNGMTKAQVERIMGPPTTIETKDMLVFKKNDLIATKTARNSHFSPFKNDELDNKEGNLALRESLAAVSTGLTGPAHASVP